MPVLFTALETTTTQPQGQGWVTIAMLVVVFAVFSFVGIRPQ